jgi:hypothetical protein
MRFWLREIAGWLLVLAGLFLFWCCLALLLNERPQYIQAGPLTLIAIIVFRGGIHLLKVAVAARIVLAAERQARRQESPRTGAATAPVDPIAQNW